MRGNEFDLAKLRRVEESESRKPRNETPEDVTFTKWGAVTITRQIFWDILMVWIPGALILFGMSMFSQQGEWRPSVRGMEYHFGGSEIPVFLVVFVIMFVKFFAARYHFKIQAEGQEPVFGNRWVFRRHKCEGDTLRREGMPRGFVVRLSDGRIAGKVFSPVGNWWQPMFELWLRDELSQTERERTICEMKKISLGDYGYR